ncbi:MAG: hypothetical protein MJA83_04715, partial [Gammaproteobacteria bacterium]|nr:hypothetical protein [Gammaproteobacteria bacterium]
MRQELFKPAAHPFKGEPNLFLAWKLELGRRMSDLELTAQDQLAILEAHTGGDALKVVQLFKQAGTDAAAALHAVWEKLTERFGDHSEIAAHLLKRVEVFPSMASGSVSPSKLRELADLCSLIALQKPYIQQLNHFDNPPGVGMLGKKLPKKITDKWAARCHKYMSLNGNLFPPFEEFVDFLNWQANLANNAAARTSAGAASAVSGSTSSTPSSSATRSLQTSSDLGSTTSRRCPIHNSDNHSLIDCNVFRRSPVPDRRKTVKESKLCFRCLADDHGVRECKSDSKCSDCGSVWHHLLLHNPKGKGSQAPGSGTS